MYFLPLNIIEYSYDCSSSLLYPLLSVRCLWLFRSLMTAKPLFLQFPELKKKKKITQPKLSGKCWITCFSARFCQEIKYNRCAKSLINIKIPIQLGPSPKKQRKKWASNPILPCQWPMSMTSVTYLQNKVPVYNPNLYFQEGFRPPFVPALFLENNDWGYSKTMFGLVVKSIRLETSR